MDEKRHEVNQEDWEETAEEEDWEEDKEEDWEEDQIEDIPVMIGRATFDNDHHYLINDNPERHIAPKIREAISNSKAKSPVHAIDKALSDRYNCERVVEPKP